MARSIMVNEQSKPGALLPILRAPQEAFGATEKKLVYMANRIADFFKAQDAGSAPAKIAEHLTKFWDPRMRQAIVAHLDDGGAGLNPAARQAIEASRS